VIDIERRGADVARRCRRCPALSALPGDGQRTEGESRDWFAAPHPPMPDFAFSRQEIADVVGLSAKSRAMSRTAATEQPRRTSVERENAG
jgi:hypothetical protein